MLNILLVSYTQENCDIFSTELLKDIEEKIKKNNLIILTQNVDTGYHTTDTPKTVNLLSYIEKCFQLEIPKLNSTENYSTSINQETNTSIIIHPLEKIIDDNIIDLVKLDKNYRSDMKACSAFNYHVKVGEYEQITNFTNIDKIYSTGLWEYIIAYNVKKHDINITVYGEYETLPLPYRLYTIIFGLKYYELYKGSDTNVITFLYDESYREYNEEEREVLYNNIKLLIEHIYTFNERRIKTFNISFKIKYKNGIIVDYNYMNENKKIQESTAILQQSSDDFNKTPKQVTFMRKQSEKNSVNYKYNKYKSKYLNISK